jgi:hypothetical protein
MPPVPFADNFLAGSLLTLLMPVGLLIAIAIWYVLAVKRVPEDTPTSSTSLPSPEVPAAASPPPIEGTQTEPPAGES